MRTARFAKAKKISSTTTLKVNSGRHTVHTNQTNQTSTASHSKHNKHNKHNYKRHAIIQSIPNKSINHNTDRPASHNTSKTYHSIPHSTQIDLSLNAIAKSLVTTSGQQTISPQTCHASEVMLLKSH